MYNELGNVVGKVEPDTNSYWKITITWKQPKQIPIKYVIYITENIGSRFSIVDGNSTSFSELVLKRGAYTYKVRAVYADGSYIESRSITLYVGCDPNCDSGGTTPEDYIWYGMSDWWK